jgi:TRAP-type mannitol/chloroaromatic compound transport system permease large subunit
MIELDPVLLTFLMFFGLLVGLLLGHPLAFVLGGLAVIFGYISWGPVSFILFTNRIIGLLDNFILVAVPMFILMANLLMQSGVADKLFDSLRYLLGPLRGGVALAVVAVSTVLAACTGVIGASVVSMGLLAFPMMNKYGYNKKLSCGTICAGGEFRHSDPSKYHADCYGRQLRTVCRKTISRKYYSRLNFGLSL